MKRFISLITAAAALAGGGGLALTGGMASASSAHKATGLPVLDVALSGMTITVSGSAVSGAVDVHLTVARGQSGVALVHLNNGITLAQVAAAARNGDPNAVQQVGAIVFDASTRGSRDVETVLPAGNYVALQVGQNGPIGTPVPFFVSRSAAPAVLPAAPTQKAIDFGFRGPTVLHNGAMIRALNRGWLVHMIVLLGARNHASGVAAVRLLRAGMDRKAGRFFTRSFVSLTDPVSHGAVAEFALHTKPGWYVEACFMNTQDGREHTRLGQVRLVHVVK